jgi:hypothetical protein
VDQAGREVTVRRALLIIFGLLRCSQVAQVEPGDDAGAHVDAGARPDGGVDAGPVDSGSSLDGGDVITSSVSWVGCNRLSRTDWNSTTNPSSANVPELTQTFADLAAMPRRPDRFVLTGDLVLGLDPGKSPLDTELAAWAPLFALAPVVPVLAVPGNHEMLVKSGGNELTNDKADAVWLQFVTASGLAPSGNGPTSAPPNDDALTDDQSHFSFSVDVGDLHLVLLNTDTPNTHGSAAIGWVPLHWLQRDLAAAQANPAIAHIFVFGHKPLVAPPGETGSDSTIDATLVQPVLTALDSTPKARGYFCAHAHLWNALRLGGSRNLFQVTAGNGGSDLQAAWAAGSPFFGFSELRVHADGRVGVVSHERPFPSPYSSATVAPAVPRAEVVISP